MKRKKDFKIKLLSVVVPAYKQEKTIVKDIRYIEKALHALKIPYEILVVIDGVVDKTYQRASKMKSRKIRVLAYTKNEGKGHAVRYGMMHAKGDIIGFIDAGMDIRPAGFKMLLSHMEWYNADAIVGSKLHPVSKVSYPFYRTVLSRGYRLLTKTLFGFSVKDTQVGMKFFKRKVIRKVLPRLLVKRYAFDIEILAVTYALGYKRIYEAPIDINFKAATITTKTLWRIVFLMLLDTTAVFYRLKIVKYYDKNSKRSKLPLIIFLNNFLYPQQKIKTVRNRKKTKKGTVSNIVLSK